VQTEGHGAINVRVRKALISVFLLMLVLYIALFPRPMGKELLVKPLWTTRLPAAAPVAAAANAAGQAPAPHTAFIRPASPGEKLLAFRLGDRFGFVGLDGTLHYLDNVRYGLALGTDRFVNYEQLSPRINVENPSGQVVASFAQDGYPVYLNDRLYVLSPDRSGISEYDKSGKLLWRHKAGSIITSVAAGVKLSVLGLLDGHIEIVDGTGTTVYRDAPTGSSIPIILGIAISAAEDRIAVVSGLEPQVLSIYERSGGQWTATQTRRLGSDFRRPVLVRALRGSGDFAFEGSESVRIYSQQGRRLVSVPLSGSLHSLLGAGFDRLILAAALSDTQSSASSGTAEVLLFLPDGRPVLRFRFPASTLYVSAEGSRQFWGVDDTIFESELTTG